jgi:hypothetical protein
VYQARPRSRSASRLAAAIGRDPGHARPLGIGTACHGSGRGAWHFFVRADAQVIAGREPREKKCLAPNVGGVGGVGGGMGTSCREPGREARKVDELESAMT